MKKQNLKGLSLNKKSISNLDTLYGGKLDGTSVEYTEGPMTSCNTLCPNTDAVQCPTMYKHTCRESVDVC